MSAKQFAKLLVESVAGLSFAGACFAGPFEDLDPGEWAEIPNSKIEDVLPNPIPPGNGPENIIDAWNSGAFDTTRNRLLITGGGHNDYGGNEVYAFDIATLQWSRIWGPSPNIPPTQGGCDQTYSDGNPVARHTYDALEYLPQVNAFWLHGGSLYCGSGGQARDTWQLDLGSLRWTRKADMIDQSVLEMVSAYDPVTGHVFLAGPSSQLGLYEFNPQANTWTARGDGGTQIRATAALDYKERRFVVIGEGEVMVYDLTGGDGRSLPTSGPQAIVNAPYPGIDYDPVMERIVGWAGGTTVYSLNVKTMAWTSHAATGTVVPDEQDKGYVFNRWRYVPSKNAFIVVNGIDQNVFIYRLSSATVPPAPPSNLTAR